MEYTREVVIHSINQWLLIFKKTFILYFQVTML